MGSAQRERGFCVVKRRGFPCGHRVAALAISLEQSRRVIGIRRCPEIFFVTCETFRSGSAEHFVDVAAITCDARVRAFQREPRTVVVDM